MELTNPPFIEAPLTLTHPSTTAGFGGLLNPPFIEANSEVENPCLPEGSGGY